MTDTFDLSLNSDSYSLIVTNYNIRTQKLLNYKSSQQILDSMSRQGFNNFRIQIFQDIFCDKALCIFVISKSIEHDMLDALVRTLEHFTRDEFGIPTNFAASKVFMDTSLASAHFYHAIRTLAENNLCKRGSTILKYGEYPYEHEAQPYLDDIAQISGRLSFNIISDHISQAFNSITGDGFNVDRIELFLIDLAYILKKHIIKNQIDSSILQEVKNMLHQDFLIKFESAAKLKSYLLSLVERVFPQDSCEKDQSRLNSILTYIHQHYTEDLSLSDLAREFYVNPSYLSQFFKSKIKMNLSTYIETLRVEEAKRLIKLNSLDIHQVGDRVGYSDASYFTKLFKKHTGVTPSAYYKSIKINLK
jgi:two-component system, response regulator YesN